VEFPINMHRRRQSASPEACYDLKTEQAVRCGLARLYLELLLQGLEHSEGAFYMTRRATANGHLVAAARLEAELIVERGDAVNVGSGYAKVLADLVDGLV